MLFEGWNTNCGPKSIEKANIIFPSVIDIQHVKYFVKLCIRYKIARIIMNDTHIGQLSSHSQKKYR